MKERTLKEIETEIDAVVPTGNIGRVMDLVDEHGHTIDKMFYAIFDCDLERIYELENLGIDVTQDSFVKAAIKHDQLLVVCHQVHQGASIDTVIEYAENYESQRIWQWAKSWKKTHFIPKTEN